MVPLVYISCVADNCLRLILYLYKYIIIIKPSDYCNVYNVYTILKHIYDVFCNSFLYYPLYTLHIERFEEKSYYIIKLEI